MPTYVFTGRMLPDQLPLTLSYSPRVSVTGAETIPDAEFHIEVEDGGITVRAEVAAAAEGLSDHLFLFAQDLARTAAEVATLADGIAYTPLIDRVTTPDGETRGLVLADRRLGDLMTAFPGHGFEKVFDLVATDVALMRALSDVVVMLTWGHYAPIAAGRVAESILAMLTGGRSAADWATMRSTLRVDRAYLQLLTDRSLAPRHGRREYVDAVTNRELAERAWTLMNRYLALRLSRATELDAAEFPMLEG